MRYSGSTTGEAAVPAARYAAAANGGGEGYYRTPPRRSGEGAVPRVVVGDGTAVPSRRRRPADDGA